MKYACAIPRGFTVAPYPERMHYSHANNTQTSIKQIKQTTTITPVHCGASRQVRMFEKVYTTTKNYDKHKRTMPPTHLKTTVRARVDNATYSTKVQLSSASLEKRCGSRHLQLTCLHYSGWKLQWTMPPTSHGGLRNKASKLSFCGTKGASTLLINAIRVKGPLWSAIPPVPSPAVVANRTRPSEST